MYLNMNCNIRQVQNSPASSFVATASFMPNDEGFIPSKRFESITGFAVHQKST